jgi:excisionase family DNA binding protein
MANNNAFQTNRELFAAGQLHSIEPRLMTREGAANYLQMSLDTLDRLCRDRKVAFYRIGRSIRFARWDLMQFLTGKPVTAEQSLENVDCVLTKPQLADFLSVSTRTIENLMRDRRFWHRKTGGVVRFHLPDVLVQLNNEFRVTAQGVTSS